jgi:DNA polymerase III sliding clamp (beta) subunit (PCNA family)
MTKIKINSDSLITALEPLQAVINPGHMVPILQCVKIDIKKNELTVTGDNHEVRCENSVDIKNEDLVVFCINHSMFIAALKSIKNQEITLKIDDKNCVVMHKSGDFKIPLEDAAIYPDAKDEKMKLTAEIDATHLKKTLKVANKFVIDNDLEPMANLSIQIGKKITIRSTNKVSLFQEVVKGSGDKFDILISGRASTAIQNLLDENTNVEMKYNENAIFFKFGRKKVMAIQQNGKFPIEIFKKIVDTVDDATPIIINKEKFLTAIRRVTALSSKEKVQTIKLIITNDNLNLSCDNINSSSRVKEDLPIKFKGELTIGFNSKMLIEVLSVFEKDAEFSLGKQNLFCISEKKMRGLIAPVLLDKA